MNYDVTSIIMEFCDWRTYYVYDNMLEWAIFLYS